MELDQDLFAYVNEQEFGVCQTIETQWSLMSMAQFKERVAECRDFLLLNGLFARYSRKVGVQPC